MVWVYGIVATAFVLAFLMVVAVVWSLREPVDSSGVSFNELIYQRTIEATFRTGLAHYVVPRSDGDVDVLIIETDGNEIWKVWTREQVINGNV